MIKLSQLTCLVSSIIVSNLAFAYADNPFYVAADIGIFKADVNHRYLDQTSDIAQNIVDGVTQHGYTGGLAIGYSKLLCPSYFLGAELSGNIENQTASFQAGAATSAFSDSVSIHGHLDLTFMPGIQLSDTVAAYLKLGASVAWLQDSLTSPAGTTPITTSTHANKNAYGFATGLRLTKLLCAHTSIFAEGNYHDYGSVDFPNFENFTATYTHTTRIYTYDVVVGASYNF